MANEKLSLHNLKNVNTVISMLYDENGNYRPGFNPETFYNTILLDTLKYGEENYVHLKWCETVNVRKGERTAKFRRWAGMTPTLRPLQEGIPPMADKHAYETMEVGNTFSFGRWSEYTDQIDLSIISEVIAERSVQYGENANQTKELYARKTWLSSPNEYYANFKNGFSDLVFGDAITLDDLRFLVARMKRMMVKPIGGKFNYICSQEFINGLIDDPRVQKYMEINQTTGNLWTSGEMFPLFEIQFIPTMLDEFAYPDVEYPGVYTLSDNKEAIRLYAVDRANSKIYYLDMHENYTVKDTTPMKTTTTNTYLKDGTAVDTLVTWELPTNATTLLATDNVTTEPTSTKFKARVQTYTYAESSFGLVKTIKYGAVTKAADSDFTAINELISEGAFMQLPIHRGILFGDEALIKINIEGLSDTPKIIVKSLGSSGVADPLDQRQSIGYKVDGFGLAIKRPEAVCITYGIPANAEFASLSAQYINNRDYTTLVGTDAIYENDANGNVVQKTNVDGVNATKANPGADTLYDNILVNEGNSKDSNVK